MQSLFIRIVLFAAGFLIFMIQGSVRGEEADNNGLLLEDLITIAMERNPQVNGSQALFQAQEKIVPKAGAWDDPRLSFGIGNFPFSNPGFTDEPITGEQIQLSQRIPLPGVKGLQNMRHEPEG